MQDMLMDVLRALGSPNLDIRQKTLDLALDLITARNIDEVQPREMSFRGRDSTSRDASLEPENPTADVRHKTLDLALDLIPTRNIDEVLDNCCCAATMCVGAPLRGVSGHWFR